MRFLYNYQQARVATFIKSRATEHRRPMPYGRAGLGETFALPHIVQMALDKVKRVCFTPLTISLIARSFDEICDKACIDIGVIQENHPERFWMGCVESQSVQTLAKRASPDKDLEQPNVICLNSLGSLQIIFAMQSKRAGRTNVG